MFTIDPEREEILERHLKRRVASFFDFDGTTSERQMLIELMIEISERFPDRRQVLEPLIVALQLYKTERTYDYLPVISAAVNAIGPAFQGLREDEVRQIAAVVLQRYGKMTYLFPRTVLQCIVSQPIEERGLIVGITGSPRELAEPFGALLGFDLVIATKLEVVDGYYTGDCDDRVVHNKGDVVDALTHRFDLDLKGSMALGDSFSDLPMLRRVGFPFAVNPQAKLLQHVRTDPTIVWINDQQKKRITAFRANAEQRFVETTMTEIMPPFLADFLPVLEEICA